MRVVLRLGVPGANWYWASRCGAAGSRDVEQRHLGAERAALLGRLLADADQPAVARRVQVRRVSGDLQLADDPRPRRVRRSTVYSGSVCRNVTT